MSMDSELTLAKGVAEGIAVGPTVPSQLTSSGEAAEESVGENIIADATDSAVTSPGALKCIFYPARKWRVASIWRRGRIGRSRCCVS